MILISFLLRRNAWRKYKNLTPNPSQQSCSEELLKPYNQSFIKTLKQVMNLSYYFHLIISILLKLNKLLL
jgi:hypothetical protein